ncbi:MAG TPA: DNA-processing protein DprA [Candidatus Paceibacterota bacterium]|nr:DNA-processing protein DprA [Candidatus Paceibacterota bacterium]
MASLIKKVIAGDTNYPHLLKEVKGAPKELYYMGVLPQFEPMVAVVGTRKATPDGLAVAKNIGFDLARAGIVVVSGLALGIDAASHEGALRAGGRTLAVLGNGLDTIYPHSHYNLAQKILDQKGGIISEYPPGTPPLPHQFLERNRIISGLALATVVIEAPIESGALVTAKHALDQGREVFVVPGRVSQNYEGSHMLLRNGARIITSAADVLEDLSEALDSYDLPDKKEKGISTRDEASLLILKTLENAEEPIYIDKIVEITKLDPNVVSQKLTFLTLDGAIEETNGKFQIK